MKREKDRKLDRRQRRQRKLRKLKTHLRETRDEKERKRLLDKIQRTMVSPAMDELEKLDKQLRPS
jgi:hypothetical protein